MNKKRIILASLIVALVATNPLVAMDSQPKKRLIAKANTEYKKLIESWTCLKRSGYRKCTPAQKKRIVVSATALAGVVVALIGGGTVFWWKRKAIPEDRGPDVQPKALGKEKENGIRDKDNDINQEELDSARKALNEGKDLTEEQLDILGKASEGKLLTYDEMLKLIKIQEPLDFGDDDEDFEEEPKTPEGFREKLGELRGEFTRLAKEGREAFTVDKRNELERKAQAQYEQLYNFMESTPKNMIFQVFQPLEDNELIQAIQHVLKNKNVSESNIFAYLVFPEHMKTTKQMLNNKLQARRNIDLKNLLTKYKQTLPGGYRGGLPFYPGDAAGNMNWKLNYLSDALGSLNDLSTEEQIETLESVKSMLQDFDKELRQFNITVP